MTGLLEEINAYSLRITKAIEIGDWDLLSDVLTQRQNRLEQLLSASISDEDRYAVMGILESVQAMDKLFIDAVRFKKAELLKEFQTVAQAQKVVSAYRLYS